MERPRATGRPAAAGLLLLACSAAACGGAATEATGTPARAQVDEPQFQVQSVGPLARATAAARLPILVGGDGAPIDLPCFARAGGLEPWETRHPLVLKKLADNEAAIAAAIRAWADEEILSFGKLAELKGKLAASFSRPQILYAPDAKVRFAADQRCVDEKARFLPDGARAVTMLVGAKIVALRGEAELTKAQLKLLRKAAKRAKVGLRPSRGYLRAIDPETGAPAVDEKGEPLFAGPGGKALTEAELPPSQERPLTGFELVLYEPLWFAWGDLPQARWRKEHDPATCRLNVVDYDATPRVPACDDRREAGYGVEPGAQAGEIVLKVASDGVTASAASEYGRTTMIQAGGRVISWITATAIEEGADLQIDSLVLMPGDRPDGDLGSFGTPALVKKKGR